MSVSRAFARPVVRSARPPRSWAPAPPRPRIGRSFATVSPSASSSRPPTRYVVPFILVCAVGGGLYGLHQYTELSQTFPLGIRRRLRAAIKAQRAEDYREAEKLYRGAYDEAKEMVATDSGKASLGSEAWLKVSGIGIKLGSMLEAEGRLASALAAYSMVLSDLRSTIDTLSGPERLRAVAVAQRIGDLAPRAGYLAGGAGSGLETADRQAEEALTWSVQELLRLTTSEGERRRAAEGGDNAEGITMSEIALPEWMKAEEVGASLEALGQFYARKGKVDYAMPLYLQALPFLLPPPPRQEQPSIPSRCHAATLMNNIAELLANHTPSNANTPVSPNVLQATEWANRALGVASTAERVYDSQGGPKGAQLGTEGDEAGECRLVQVVARQNLGMLAEMSGDRQGARRHFEEAEQVAKALGLRQGVLEAKKGMRRVSAGTT